MFFLQQPSSDQIDTILGAQAQSAFTYHEVGSTKYMFRIEQNRQSRAQDHNGPRGYVVDHNRVWLGNGPACFQLARKAIQQWEMFAFNWVDITWEKSLEAYPPIHAGCTVGVLARRPIWSLNPCRIVYTLDEEADGVHRFGFGYGTLPGHIAKGEERFLVEWHTADNSVWYDIVAFSRPSHLLALAGYPVVRLLQKRFAYDSKAALVSSCSRTCTELQPPATDNRFTFQ